MDSWQDSYSHPLTPQDAREMVSSVSAFFGLLAKWSDEERVAAAPPKGGAATRVDQSRLSGLVPTDISTRKREEENDLEFDVQA